MKTKETNMMKELGLRVMNDIFDDQLMKFIFEGNPLMTTEELSDFIVENLEKYLNPDEVNSLLTEQLGIADDERIKELGIRLISHLCALNITQAIEATLTHPSFAKNNPFNILTNPMHFIIHKYLTEEMGVDIDFSSKN